MVLVFTVFLLFVLRFLCCLVYVYLFLFVVSVLVKEPITPSDISTAVNNNNNNNNNNLNYMFRHNGPFSVCKNGRIYTQSTMVTEILCFVDGTS